MSKPNLENDFLDFVSLGNKYEMRYLVVKLKSRNKNK
jgi:hypothetical protein